MQLKGACYCGAVSFSVETYALCPYKRCYCSICRKTADDRRRDPGAQNTRALSNRPTNFGQVGATNHAR